MGVGWNCIPFTPLLWYTMVVISNCGTYPRNHYRQVEASCQKKWTLAFRRARLRGGGGTTHTRAGELKFCAPCGDDRRRCALAHMFGTHPIRLGKALGSHGSGAAAEGHSSFLGRIGCFEPHQEPPRRHRFTRIRSLADLLRSAQQNTPHPCGVARPSHRGLAGLNACSQKHRNSS